MSKIRVVDAICGSGKTSAAISYMKERTDSQFIYVTPFLDEIKRVQQTCKPRRFHEPEKWKTKTHSFNFLLEKGRNITTTHSLFRNADSTTRELIKTQPYILILDEVMSVVEVLGITKRDLEIIKDQKLAHVDESCYLIWDDKEYKGKYDSIKAMAENKNIIVVNGTALLWSFPVNVFECFDEVWILTYIFDGQIQKSYFDFHNVEYKYYSVNDEMTKFIEGKPTKKTDYGKLIDVYDGKYNEIGEDIYSLSKSWFVKKDKSIINILQKNIYNYFNNHVKSKAEFNLWTTFKDEKKTLSGKGYIRGFLPCNARATNDYKHKTTLAYCINRYANPLITGFFKQNNIEFDEDAFALSEIIQWIFRSQLREKKPISIYIPSSRMRKLLLHWMDNN